jgi:hypothetical protein
LFCKPFQQLWHEWVGKNRYVWHPWQIAASAADEEAREILLPPLTAYIGKVWQGARELANHGSGGQKLPSGIFQNRLKIGSSTPVAH